MDKRFFAVARAALFLPFMLYGTDYDASDFIAANYPTITENSTITLDVPIIVDSDAPCSSQPFKMSGDYTLAIYADSAHPENAYIELGSSSDRLLMPTFTTATRILELHDNVQLRINTYNNPSGTYIIVNGVNSVKPRIKFKDQSSLVTNATAPA